MSKLKLLLKISRPRFWIYVFGPYLIGLAAAAKDRDDFLGVEALVFALYFLLPANLLIYGINDIFDYETDKRNPKKQDYETLVEPAQRKSILFYIGLLNIPFILLSFVIFDRPSIALLAFLFFSVLYSAPPIRAKTKPFLDSAFNILYVFPGVFSYALLSGSFPSWAALLAAGCWTAAMHAFSAIPDIKVDKDAGINTIATFLGSGLTIAFCFLCYGVASLLGYQLIGVASIFFGTAYFLMLLVSLRNHKETIFNVYRWFPVLNSTVGFLLFWLIAFSKIV